MISFISQSNRPNSYSAASTAVVSPPVPFETFIPTSAREIQDELRVKGMETFTFDHGNDRLESHYGKAPTMEMGCIDHFSWITQTLYNLSSDPRKIFKDTSKRLPDTFRIITFIYKPKQDGWIVVETRKHNGKAETYIYPRANKADRSKEIMGQETLYFDSKERRKVIVNGNGLRAHFETVINEVENNLGYFLRFRSVRFNRDLTKKLLKTL